jgi:glycosyltransferase involved in cell wall biosynthesis
MKLETFRNPGTLNKWLRALLPSSAMLGVSTKEMSRNECGRHIHLLAILEASTVTGPAKNLLDFCRASKNLAEGPIIDTSIITFERVGRGRCDSQVGENVFIQESLRTGIAVHCIPERYTFDTRVMSCLKKLIHDLCPDIIQTHGLKSHFLVRACGGHKNRVWVAFHHGYTLSTIRRAMLAHLDRWSLLAASQVITVSKAFAKQLSARGIPSSKIVVLHNSVDVNRLHSGTLETPANSIALGQSTKEKGLKLILSVGRLSREKGFPDLIDAVRHLKDMRPELSFKLLIVGEGQERSTIEQMIRRLGLEQEVCPVGYTRSVSPYYDMADVVAIPSWTEGSPNVLLEAMAAGIPVVATAVGGIPEIVTSGETALLVPPRDPIALANALDRLLHDPPFAMAIATRAQVLVRERYSIPARVTALVHLYDRLVSPSNYDGRSTDPLITQHYPS